MENSGDFLLLLGHDISTKILTLLDDPSDLIHMCLVLRSWRYFIIENGLLKRLCMQKFPEMLCFAQVSEVGNSVNHMEVGSSDVHEWEKLKKEHRVYAGLAHNLMSIMTVKDCIETSVHASSTDNYPDESIGNTLDPRENVDGRPSYWSSTGSSDPELPETLTYKLRSHLCVVNEINIRPFKATFQFGDPIYSAKAVRFRMGHSMSPLDLGSMDDIMEDQSYTDDNFIWTYESPIFPMVQENRLQTFRLPEPALCIGGVLQIELQGRIQKQEMDNLYYICVCHVQVVGQPLPPMFDVDLLDSSEGNFVLKYSPDAENWPSPSYESKDGGVGTSGWQAIAARIRQIREGRVWNRVVILNTLLGNVAGGNNDSDDELMN